MYNYILTREAKEDLLRIYEYGVFVFGESQAEKYLKTLHICFEKIASNPFMFPVVEKYEHIDRFCVCGVDTIYYKIKELHIEIITIIGRQNF